MAAMLMAMVGVACGTTEGVAESSTSPLVAPKKGSMEACLLSAGAKRAGNEAQLAFLKRAEAEDEVDKPGFVFDKVTKTIVRLWETAASEGRTPEWAVWFGQPFEDDREPLDIVKERPPKSFVAFVRNPGERVWKRASQCPRLPKSTKGSA